MIKGLIGAFSMYSAIPMSSIKWDEKTDKYLIGWLPLVGVVIGLCYILIFRLCSMLEIGIVLKGALLTSISVIITGGIHIDGFIDTMDAISSYQAKEKRLEILKDPHVGAFGIIWTIIYFLLYFGLSTEISESTVYLVAGSFIISRSLTVIASIGMNKSSAHGSLFRLTEKTSKWFAISIAIFCLVLIFSLSVCYMFWTGVLMLATGLICTIWFSGFAIKNFGGISGDLVGFLLSSTELLMLIMITMGERLGQI